MAFSVLLHAETTPSEYALKLVDGTVLLFEQCKTHGDFALLLNPRSEGFPYPLENGIDVRVSHILWIVETKRKR